MRYSFRYLASLLLLWSWVEARAQFTTIINAPPTVIDDYYWIGSDTQVNVFDGGSVGRYFGVGVFDGSSTNVELNVTGGNVGFGLNAYGGSVVNVSGGIVQRSFDAKEGSKVNISGGSVWSRMSAFAGSEVSILGGSIGNEFFAEAGSAVRLVGGEFRLDGTLIDGLDAVGTTLPVDLPVGSVLSGTFADGTPFAFWGFEGDISSDDFSNGTLTLERAELPPVGPALITVTGDEAPRGVRGGQTLVVEDGGQVGVDFNAGPGSIVQINGGEIDQDFEAVGAHVSLAAGVIGRDFRALSGSVVNISGGSIHSSFRATEGSEVNITGGVVNSFEAGSNSLVNISGGRIGTSSRAFDDSEVNISGGSFVSGFFAESGSQIKIIGNDFRFNGVPISGLETIGNTVPFDLPFGSVLSGILADGTPFAFGGLDYFDTDEFRSELTLESEELPAAGPALIYSPGDPIPFGIREGQRLVVNPGGVVEHSFNAGPGSIVEIDGGEVGQSFEAVGAQVTLTEGMIGINFKAYNGTVVDISGGTVGHDFYAKNGSVVNISGGSIGSLMADSGSMVNIAAGTLPSYVRVVDSDLRISGGSIGGLGISRSTASVSDGSIGTVGIDVGSVLNMSGGSIEDFETGQLQPFGGEEKAIVNISGGTIGDGWWAQRGSVVTITGGTIGNFFRADNGSKITIAGGEIGRFRPQGGSEVSITGGTFNGSILGNAKMSISGGIFERLLVDILGKVNLLGTQFVLDNVDITDSLQAGVPLVIADRNVTLSGLFADGTPFSFDLNTTLQPGLDFFDPTAMITVTLVAVPEPGAFAIVTLGALAGLFKRRRAR